MRRLARASSFEEDGAGYLIAVSDVMSGLLFVFIITLMAYVLNIHFETQRREVEREEAAQERARYERENNRLREEIRKTEREKEVLRQRQEEAIRERQQFRLENERLRRSQEDARRQARIYSGKVEELTNSRALRAELLKRIRDELARNGIRVLIDTVHGILRLTDEALRFPSGDAELREAEREKLKVIGGVLADVLPCYVGKPEPGPECPRRYVGRLESVFVEGHTDNRPYIGGRFRDNWDLSAQRAMYTYRTMVEKMYPVLGRLKNADDFPIFSVSGYGEGRPVIRHEQPRDEPANRRIDLRFIMTPPSLDLAPVRELKERGL